MKKMIGFRNIAIHDYKQIDEGVLEDVIKNHLTDLTDFAKEILNLERWKENKYEGKRKNWSRTRKINLIYKKIKKNTWKVFFFDIELYCLRKNRQ